VRESLQSRREYHIIIKRLYISTRIMYDDYDLEYSFSNENILDEDMLYEMYHGVHNVMDENDDDDYARDNDTYEALAYRHYA